MNNAFILNEKEEPEKSVEPILRERMEKVIKIIEALQNIAGSNYWIVLQKSVFGVDLSKAKKSLAKEKDTTEMFRLQGELRWEDNLNLERQIQRFRNELEAIKRKLNG